LLPGAILKNGGNDGAIVHRQDRRKRGVGGRDLHERERVGNEIGVGAAKSFRGRHPHQSEIRKRPEDFLGIPFGGLEGMGTRRNLFLRKFAGRLANRFLRLGQ